MFKSKEKEKPMKGLKPVTKDQKGLKKLPTKVRNKMGYMKSGGRVMKYKKGGMVCPINGMAKKGKTRGVTVVA
tara:strand:- start:603 stop:821 length:219 start_codon:yes stop_codon:yes gene_type:complete